jgi:DNA-binding response OmpR family regulator
MSEPAAPNRSPRKCILLVDDEEDVLEFVSEMIHLETPHTVISCRTAIQALVAASRQSFHLFILDYQLPDLNGLKLHDQLQTFAHLKDLPTIMISAYEPPFIELHRRHIVLLRKPFGLSQLLAGIQTALA